MTIGIVDRRPAVGTPIRATVRLTARAFVPTVRLRVKSEGVVTLEGPTRFSWPRVGTGLSRAAQVTFRLGRPGEGELQAVAEGLGPDGRLLYGRTATVYFLVGPDAVLSSTVSPTELRLAKLRTDLEAGRIDRRTYERERRRILGGGASESNG